MKIFKNQYSKYGLFSVTLTEEEYTLQPKGEVIPVERYNGETGELYMKTWYSMEVELGELQTDDLIELFETWNLKDLNVIFEEYPYLQQVYASYVGTKNKESNSDGEGVALATGMVIGNMMNNK